LKNSFEELFQSQVMTFVFASFSEFSQVDPYDKFMENRRYQVFAIIYFFFSSIFFFYVEVKHYYTLLTPTTLLIAPWVNSCG